MLLAISGVALALAACARAGDDAATPAPPVPQAVADPCAASVAEFARTLKSASGACRIDADCACYPGGIGEASGCGDVTDAASASALKAVASRYLQAGCQHTVQCAPWLCAPKCRKGFCLR
jgi:hypothetical protein